MGVVDGVILIGAGGYLSETYGVENLAPPEGG